MVGSGKVCGKQEFSCTAKGKKLYSALFISPCQDGSQGLSFSRETNNLSFYIKISPIFKILGSYTCFPMSHQFETSASKKV